MKKILFVLLLVFVQPLSAQTATESLNEFLTSVKSLSAKFEQSILDTTSANAGRFQGVLYLSRPGRFRWDYFEPGEKMILGDGEDVYVVDNELEQITYVSQERALQGTPASVLIGDQNIDERFEVIEIGSSQGMQWLELLPRDAESQFTRILLAFVGPELRRMEMADKLGQITRFQFYDVQRNLELDEKLFRFVSPRGFDVLE